MPMLEGREFGMRQTRIGFSNESGETTRSKKKRGVRHLEDLHVDGINLDH